VTRPPAPSPPRARRTPAKPPTSELLSTIAAIVFVALWAGAYVAVKICQRDVPPFTLLFLRFAVAGLALLPIAAALRSPWPRGGLLLRVAALGLTTNAIYLGMTFQALRFVSAGLGSVIGSTNPLILAAVAPFTIGEHPSRQTLVGLLLGFAGVVGVMSPRIGSGGDSPFGALLMTAAISSMVASTVIFKRLPPGGGLLAITVCQLLVAAGAILPFALLFEQGLPGIGFELAGWLGFLYLSFGVSVGGSLLWFWLLSRGVATGVSAWLFLTPALGLGLAVVVLGVLVGVA
jgi:drug/metabolite transporter (DMT)-like permease